MFTTSLTRPDVAVEQPKPTRDPVERLLKYDAPVPRYTSYPTAAAFSTHVGAEQLNKQLGQADVAPLSLYVHVPFCRHACWYCGCNRVTTGLGSKVVQPYLETLERELQLIRAAMPRRRRLAQLHWGGGTPNPQLPHQRGGRPAVGADRPPVRSGAGPGSFDRTQSRTAQQGRRIGSAAAGLQPGELRDPGR